MERETGIEPATLSLEGWCSANWATPAFKKEKIIDNGRYPISKFSNFLLALFKPNSSEKIYHRNVVWTIQSEFSKRLNGWDNRSLASLVERGGCARSLRSLRLPLVAEPNSPPFVGERFSSSIPSKKNWWRGEDSNLRRHRQQIYSLSPLAAREPLRL